MMPSVFISHGPPDRVLGNSSAKEFLQGFAQLIPKPRAILICSAHWMTNGLRMSNTGSHETLYDFWGFPKALSQIQYPASQPEWLTQLVVKQFRENEIEIQREDRGLDHGAWSVLKLAFPDASIPVIALSLPSTNNLQNIFDLGQSLKSLRNEGVLIIGSGSTTHNLRALSFDNQTPDWAIDFSRWLQKAVREWDTEALCNPYQFSSCGAIAHPTLEHYAPLLIAAGAASGEDNQLLHDSFEYGSLNNSSWLFGKLS